MEQEEQNEAEALRALQKAIENFLRAAPDFPEGENLASQIGTAFGKLAVLILHKE